MKNIVLRISGVILLFLTGCCLTRSDYRGAFSDVRSFSEDCAPAETGGYWGFMDKDCRLAVNSLYQDVRPFSNGKAAVKKNNLWGYVDKCGNVVIQLLYEDAGSFKEGLSPVMISGLWKYIGENGSAVISPRFKKAKDFSEGLAAVSTNNLWGFIDKNGSFIIQPVFDDAGNFGSGLAPVKNPSGKWGYIGRSGINYIIMPAYEDATAFSEDLAAVKTGLEEWRYINTGGQAVSAITYLNALPYSDGLAAVKIDQKWGFIDKNGTLKISNTYDEASSFGSGLALVKKDGAVFYIDKSGEPSIFPPILPRLNQGASRGDLLAAVRLADYSENLVKEKVDELKNKYITNYNNINPLSRWLFDRTEQELIIFGLSGVPRKLELYRLIYRTIDAKSNFITNSGLLIMPKTRMCERTPYRAPILSLQHATQYMRTNAPSYNMNDPQVLVGIVNAGIAGFITAMPDYPGMGFDKHELHPYCHGKSIAFSVVDMIRAARIFCATNSAQVKWDGRVAVMGYSEGGYSTMAAARELETFHSIELPLMISEPLAGPFDISGTMKNVMLQDTPFGAPDFLPYVVLGYSSIYGAFNPSSALNVPYDTSMPLVIDGEHSLAQISSNINTNIPKAMLSSVFIGMLNNPGSPVMSILRENDLYKGWMPKAPMILMHSPIDELVPYSNSVVAYNAFTGSGAAKIKLINLYPTSHEVGGIQGLLAATVINIFLLRGGVYTN